jgi:tetratricopeptide (TPR) repeat protein
MRRLDEALAVYLKSLVIRHQLSDGDKGNAQLQRELQSVIGDIDDTAYRLVLTRDFAKALEATDRIISVAPDRVGLYANRAYALMFLGPIEEARALYLQCRGTKNVIGNKSWEAVILEDFAELRKAGLQSPLMNEIEELAVDGDLDGFRGGWRQRARLPPPLKRMPPSTPMTSPVT